MLKAIGKAFEQSEIVADIRETGGGKNLLIEVFKFLVLIFAADSIANRFASYVLNHEIEPLASLWGIWLLAIGLCAFAAIGYVVLWEDLRPRNIGVCFRPVLSCLRNFVVGYVLGGVIMSVVVVVSALLGGYAIADNFQQVRAGSVILIALIYVFQSFGEEVLYRGAGMMCLSRKNSPIVALIVTSAIFSLHHFHNHGYGPIAFVNLFLFAVLCGMTVFATNQIWMATAIHAAWNFFQGNVFGVNVSGTSAETSAMVLTGTAKGMPLITGGQMGLEGSLVSTVVLLVAVIIFAWRLSKKPVQVRQRPTQGKHMARPSEN